MFQTLRARYPDGLLWLFAVVQAAAMLGFHLGLRALVS